MTYQVVEWAKSFKPYQTQDVISIFAGYPKTGPCGDCLIVKDSEGKYLWIFSWTAIGPSPEGIFTVKSHFAGQMGDTEIGQTELAKTIIKDCNEADIAEGLLMNHSVALEIRKMGWV